MIKEKVVEKMDLPRDIALNTPKITIFDKVEIWVENYKGIMEYTDIIARIKTNSGIFVIEGKNLFIATITDEEIVIKGIIDKTSWL